MFSSIRLRRFTYAALQRLTRTTQIYVIIIAVLSIAALLVTVYFTTTTPVAGGRSVFEERNFSHTPFNLMDAHDACLLETQKQLGAGFLRAYMMPLSTRYEEEEGVYLVVLNADVGTMFEWEAATIYCTVDPKANEISYYKEVWKTDSGEPSMSNSVESIISHWM